LLEDPVDVIVVDSASEPPCRELVETYRPLIENLQYLREETPGHSRARNRGVAAATGQLVAFLDDDSAPRPDWARSIAAPFVSDPAIGCVGGACLPSFRDGPRPAWLSDRLLQFAAITRFGQTGRVARSSAEWPFGANMAFRREALQQAGPFSERLGRSGSNLISGDEWAVTESVRHNGWRIWLEPSAVVDHAVSADRCRSRYYWRRLWAQGITRARSSDSSAVVGLRLLAALVIRLFAFGVTRDRVFLYRTAETVGFFAERVRLRGSPT
jgi:cellulose synthase/poly-beta-1,6-N-acetylglucosamine synthase-like glycosyltransferase